MGNISNLSIAALILLASQQGLASTGRMKNSQPGKNDVSAVPWMKCISGDAKVGIAFTLEPNNGNVISVDTYSLNSQGKKIKQIGHAEVMSANTSNGSGVATVVLAKSADSPFAFNLSLSAASPGASPAASASASPAPN